MPVQFKKVRVTIPAGKGAKTVPGSARFDTRVIKSEFMLGGFKFNYASQDHHIDEIEINLLHAGSTQPDPNAALFIVECRYQDKNGDDPWDGHVDVVVAAEVQ